MPSTVFVRFESPAPVPANPRRLHAAVSSVFDLPEGLSAARAASLPVFAHRPPHEFAGPKPYCLGELSYADGLFGMEIRFLDDRLVDTLDAWLAWGGVLRIGNGGEDTVVLAAVDGQVIEHQSWEELTECTEDTTWEIHLVTPTVFSSRGQHVWGVSPASLATSLQERWWHADRASAPGRVDREAMARVLTTYDETRQVPVSLGMPRSDRRGRLASRTIIACEGRMRVSGPAASPLTRVFSQLMALSRFTNVGSHANFGMGVIDSIAVDRGVQPD